MTQSHQTKDMRFMIALYEMALHTGNVYAPISRFDIGTAIGLHVTALQTITRTLLQTNFIKKDGEENVCLTPHGEKLVKKLLGLE